VCVARPLGDLIALLEVSPRPVILPQIRVRDAQVGVRDRAAMLVIRAWYASREPRSARGLVQVPLDVRHDAEVSARPGAELAALTLAPAACRKFLRAILDRALHVQPAERVQRFRGEQIVAASQATRLAPAAQLTRFGRPLRRWRITASRLNASASTVRSPVRSALGDRRHSSGSPRE